MVTALAEIKAIAPADMSIGDVCHKAFQASAGGGSRKFIEGDTKTLIYWITSISSGLCRNCWTIDMWATDYEKISLEKFYLFLQETLKHLKLLSSDERQKIFCNQKEFEMFDEFLDKTLNDFKLLPL